jgi:uncharacterized protein YceH (UPF0502 family)
MQVLTPEQLRVLGALIEKEATIPDQYPLTLNALLNATNQTSNRNPVTSYDPETVTTTLGELRGLGLARVVHQPGQRADKYRHVVHEAWGLTREEIAVLAVLALRGPQTVNDLRTRTERYGDLGDMGGVEGVLHRLKNRYEEPYVTRLDRSPGQREERWAHLLDVPTAPSVARSSGSQERVAELEARVEAVEARLAAMEDRFETLWQQLS